MATSLAFEKKYKSLNPEQKRAVDTVEGPVMVIAGPGTGKTTILTLRIANILQKTDTPPSDILALTFTETGVKAMRQKLREIIGSRAEEVRIHTFHGFAASVIAEFDDHFPALYRSKQITDVEAESIVRSILKEKKFLKLRPFGDPDFYVSKILSAIGDSKKEAWSPDTVENFAKGEIERIQNDPSELSSRGATKGELKADAKKRIEKCEKTILFADVYRAYEAKKREEKKMDFDDLLFELVKALQEDELLLRQLQEKFLYILVDEHQDTNDSQNLIVSLLSNFFDTPNIFVVGDEKQAIYRFQGASVENFLRFQKLWKDMQVISLVENYRSHQHILDASHGMIEKNYAEGEYLDLRTRLTSGSGEKEKPIEIVSAGNTLAADAFLVEKLKEVEAGGKTAAIIVRKNKEVEHVLSLAERNNISVSAERGADIFSHPLGVMYFNLLQYAVDPSRDDLLAEGLAFGLWNKSFDEGAALIRKIRSGTVEDISGEIPGAEKLQSAISRLAVLDYLVYAAEVSNLNSFFVQSPLTVEVWRGILSLASDIAMRGEIEDPRILIQELLAYKASAEKKIVKIRGGKSDAKIEVMTAHSSKGLEYDFVFLPYATEESWMRRPRSSSFVLPREKEDGDEERDSRRLFYVAITRARSHVVIVSPLEDIGGRTLSPLRFIDELDPKSLEKKEIPFLKDSSIASLGFDFEEKEKQDMVEYTKRSILEKGLSVTALNHFETCPSQFFYKSILKLPEPPNATSEKGIAMHKALALAWKAEDRSIESVTRIIESTVHAHFKVCLLPTFEKESIVEELVVSAPIVATALADFFQSPGHVSTEVWVNAEYKTKDINFELHGQLDTILETEENVFVYDYKTREAMSLNALKGETKDSDGKYFRQLVFYKMLLSGNHKFTGKGIESSLVFVKPDSKGRCPIISIPVSDEDMDRVRGEVDTLVHSVWSGEFLSQTCDDEECRWCGLKNQFSKKNK